MNLIPAAATAIALTTVAAIGLALISCAVCRIRARHQRPRVCLKLHVSPFQQERDEPRTGTNG